MAAREEGVCWVCRCRLRLCPFLRRAPHPVADAIPDVKSIIDPVAMLARSPQHQAFGINALFGLHSATSDQPSVYFLYQRCIAHALVLTTHIDTFMHTLSVPLLPMCSTVSPFMLCCMNFLDHVHVPPICKNQSTRTSKSTSVELGRM